MAGVYCVMLKKGTLKEALTANEWNIITKTDSTKLLSMGKHGCKERSVERGALIRTAVMSTQSQN